MRRKCADDARSMAAMSGRSYAGMGRLSSLICRYMRPGAFDAEHLGRRVRPVCCARNARRDSRRAEFLSIHAGRVSTREERGLQRR
jgi:hypothetical protein